MNEPKFKRIQCIDRALDILEAVAQRDCRTMADIAGRVGLNLATTYNLVKTLMARGYIEERFGVYGVGEALGILAKSWNISESLPYVVRPMLTQIALRLENHHVSVATRSDSCIHTAMLLPDGSGKYRDQFLTRTWNDPLYLAAGRVIVAFGNEAEWMKAIEYHLDRGVQDPSEAGIGHYELYKKLETVRRDACASMMMQSEDSTPFGAVAVPLFSPEGVLLGAVGASCYGDEATPERMELIKGTLQAAATEMWPHT